MYYYPVSAVLTECLKLSLVEQQDSYGYEISQTGSSHLESLTKD